jgi:hypothetical protein
MKDNSIIIFNTKPGALIMILINKTCIHRRQWCAMLSWFLKLCDFHRRGPSDDQCGAYKQNIVLTYLLSSVMILQRKVSQFMCCTSLCVFMNLFFKHIVFLFVVFPDWEIGRVLQKVRSFVSCYVWTDVSRSMDKLYPQNRFQTCNLEFVICSSLKIYISFRSLASL